MKSELPHACIPPGEEEILSLINTNPVLKDHSEMLKESYLGLIKGIMIHYKGAVNPNIVRETIKKLLI